MSYAGYGCNSIRQFYACARLYDEVKEGDVWNEVTSLIESSVTPGETKERDLKLDIHKQFENSETISKWSGETIKKKSRSVVKNGVTSCEPLNCSKSVDWNDETFDFNMLVNLDVVSRKKLLIELIAEQ